MQIDPKLHLRVLCGSRKAGTVEGIPLECKEAARGATTIRDDNEYALLVFAGAPQAELDTSRVKTGMGNSTNVIGGEDVDVGLGAQRIPASSLGATRVAVTQEPILPKPQSMTSGSTPTVDAPVDHVVTEMVGDLVDNNHLSTHIYAPGNLLITKSLCLVLKLGPNATARDYQLLSQVLDGVRTAEVVQAMQMRASAIEV